MLFFLEKKTVRMNQIIFKEGQEPDGIYLIREGEIKVTKNTINLLTKASCYLWLDILRSTFGSWIRR